MKTLKLLAVLLAPTGTVYMLLGDEGRHPEEWRHFDCNPRAYHTSGSYSQALVANISPRQSQSNG